MSKIIHLLFKSEEKVALWSALSTSLLSFLQGLDGAEIAGFTAMQGFLKDFGYFDEKTNSWGIRPNIQLVITCLISVGAAIGAAIAGPFGTRFGQRWGLMLCAAIEIAGSVVQLVATSLGGLIPGRLLIGIGIGMATNFVLVYQAEVTPKRYRGLVLVSYGLFVTLGGFAGTCVNKATADIDNRWCYRIPLLTQLVCPAIFLCIAWMLPNSPRFLVSRNRIEEARIAHSRLHGSSENTRESREAEMKEIVLFVEIEKENQRSTTYLDCFRGTDRRRTLIAMGLMTAQNFIGRDFLGSYGTYFFAVAGVKNPFLISVILNMLSLFTTLAAFPLVHYFRRRQLVLPGIAVAIVSLFVFSSVGTAIPHSESASKVLVTFMITYNMGYHLALGVMASMIVSESACTRLRSQAQSVTVFTAWSWAVMWTAVLPYLINPDAANLGAKIGFMYGGFGIVIFIFVYFCVPEYYRRSLEELDEMFIKRVPAREFKKFSCTGSVEGHQDAEKRAITHIEESPKDLA